MGFIDFSENLKTGSREIDLQHKRIFNYLNSLYELNRTRQPNLLNKLHELLNYIYAHFSYEEELMNEYGKERFLDHIQEHLRFKEKVEEIIRKNKESEYSMIFEVSKFIKSFYIEHIFYYDKIMVKFLNE